MKKTRQMVAPIIGGEWAVLVERDGRTDERYFPDQETANKYVEENGLEGRVPIFEVD